MVNEMNHINKARNLENNCLLAYSIILELCMMMEEKIFSTSDVKILYLVTKNSRFSEIVHCQRSCVHLFFWKMGCNHTTHIKDG